MKTHQFPHSRLIRFLLPVLLSAILLPSCGEIRSTDTPVPAALQIGYRRMFNHDRSELAFTPFAEAVQKSGSITLARLDNAEDTGEGYARYMSAIETAMAVAPTPESFVPTSVAAVPTLTPTPKVYMLLDEYKNPAARNSDMRGWIRQEGTVIDYPVMQSKDNDWYLSRNIDKKKVVTGSIVLDFRVDIKNLGRNTPVYGHNMKHGSMFHSLVNYKTEKYFKDHPVIRFDTLYEKMKWEVFAVYVVDSGYNYVITMDFTDDAEFQQFLDDIRKRSIYPMPFEVTTDDQIMTMVTCSYEFDGARTIVQARLKK